MVTKQQLKLLKRYSNTLISIAKVMYKVPLTFRDYYFHVNSIKNKIKFIEDDLGITFLKNKNNLFYYNKRITKLPILDMRKFNKVGE